MERTKDVNKDDSDKKYCNPELNLSFKNLKSIPENVIQMKYLRSLNLSNNLLTELPTEIKNLKSLLSLDLSCNQLKKLPQSLSEIAQLKYVNISNNKFTDVPPVILESLNFIRILDLSHNEIKYFTDPPSCICNLVELNLSHNKLMKLPNWIFSVECIIKNLDISFNELSCMTENFLNGNVLIKLMTKLQLLNLGNCGLSSENLQFISNMTALETLKLSNDNTQNAKSSNCLDNLNLEIFEKCLNLKNLYLSNCQISFLPNNFGYFTHVRYLNLEGNCLTWLPDSFCDLHSLEICVLSKNMISFLPQQIGKLINLKEIYLNSNNITYIGDCFNSLVKLQVCDLYENKLEYIHSSIINLESLKGIDLEGNYLDFHSICGNKETYKQFMSKYSVMKEHYRKRISETRCDLQILEKDDTGRIDEACSTGSEEEFKSSLTGVPDADTVEARNCLEDWDGDNSNVVPSELEHDDFDPNVNYGATLKWKRTDKSNVYDNNFCPADNHIPSIRKYFLRKRQDITVEAILSLTSLGFFLNSTYHPN